MSTIRDTCRVGRGGLQARSQPVNKARVLPTRPVGSVNLRLRQPAVPHLPHLVGVHIFS